MPHMDGTADLETVNQLIASNGYWPGDPRVIKIIQYTNQHGNVRYGLIYESMKPAVYRPSSFVFNPQVVWKAVNKSIPKCHHCDASATVVYRAKNRHSYPCCPDCMGNKIKSQNLSTIDFKPIANML